jgi:hypothetical protein
MIKKERKAFGYNYGLLVVFTCEKIVMTSSRSIYSI